MLEQNERFQEFRAQLAERGVSIRWAWQAKRDPKSKRCDVHFALFNGSGFQPRLLTAIIIDYGPRDGFGLYTDRGGSTITVDADTIAGDGGKHYREQALATANPQPDDGQPPFSSRAA